MRKKIIVLGADHAGFAAKEFIKKELLKMDYEVIDAGTYSKESVDYPDYVKKAVLEVKDDKRRKAILTCGTGIGASIAANKVPGIRAALVRDTRDARLSREHNDANVLVLGGRRFDRRLVKRVLRVWLNSEFLGGRHLRRVRKIARMEAEYANL
jgi:ribose 5-phosphate isomerase B